MLEFCEQCNNLMYPQEDRQRKQLMQRCRTCGHTKRANNNEVYGNAVQPSATGDSRKQEYSDDLVDDPTLPVDRDVECPQCFENDVCFWMLRSVTSAADDAMLLVFMCRQCKHVFRQDRPQARSRGPKEESKDEVQEEVPDDDDLFGEEDDEAMETAPHKQEPEQDQLKKESGDAGDDFDELFDDDLDLDVDGL
ncbi:MAG: hypothetical protein MHM6MM_000278 [Cercozoa sp. M6MM]